MVEAIFSQVNYLQDTNANFNFIQKESATDLLAGTLDYFKPDGSDCGLERVDLPFDCLIPQK